MTIRVQEKIFKEILYLNFRYMEQRRYLEELKAALNRQAIQDLGPPDLASENIRASGEFGLIFSKTVAGT